MSFYRRQLPDDQIVFSSPRGRAIFAEALAAGTMECFFALSEQFHTQAEPAFCGLGSLVVALNALGVDPGRAWRGPWRWFGEEMLDCCVPLDEVRRVGLTMDEVGCLARCNGARARVRRARGATVDELRASLASASRMTTGRVVVAAYSRASLGQTGDGHFSPIGGVHEGHDLALIMDVARFKYPPHWVPISRLFAAMQEVDAATGKARGWLELEGTRAAMPLLAALRLEGDWRSLLVALATETPRALADVHAKTGREATRAVLTALPKGLVDTVGLVRPGELDVPEEYRRLARAAEAELATTRACALVCASGDAWKRRPALAALLLALPDAALGDLSGPGRAELDLARSEVLPPGLASEIELLREQLVTLFEEARCARR